MEEKIFFYNPVWLPLYTAFCIAGSFPFLLVTWFVFHWSVASDVVFGLLVIVGGPFGDYLFRRMVKRQMYFLPNLNIPVMYAWPAIGLLVMIIRPFE